MVNPAKLSEARTVLMSRAGDGDCAAMLIITNRW